MLTDSILQFAAERAQRYVKQVGERRVAPTENDLAALAKFHEPFPAGPSDPRDVVQFLDDLGSPRAEGACGGEAAREDAQLIAGVENAMRHGASEEPRRAEDQDPISQGIADGSWSILQ